LNKIIESNDTLYEVLGTMNVTSVKEEGIEIWKKRWGSDSLLRNKNIFYFCRKVIDAEFEDIK
jgi:hypothetical protein